MYSIISFDFFCAGLGFSICVHVRWQLERYWIKSRKRAGVDLMNSDPSDSDQTHTHNLEPSIAFVKSNDCNFISHSANHGVTLLPVDAPMKIGWKKSRRSGLASWDHGPLIACDGDASWPFKHSFNKMDDSDI